ncbi:hypothetical protein NM688_g2120 [Phlebia brevispora]|uniref:Uncharacterized protein n=1 Tax=Phlebia brevispora TaxID=194682 RepID=A0ACC1T9I0_9APHY|nr:hypothetical protein NM688_g2120 [Phlebia brevispora]
MGSSRVWVITGVNVGLGLALALYVSSKGDKVIGTVRAASKFPAELREAGALPLVVDLCASDEEIKRAAEAALSIFGSVDVLVNNAGYCVFGAIEEVKVSDFRAQFQTNFFGLIAFTQPFIAHFRNRRCGHIVNTSSMAGCMPFPSLGVYCASKAALNAFSDTLSVELKLFGVRVLNVLPGYFSSQLFFRHHDHTSAPSTVVTSGGSTQLSDVYTDPQAHGYDMVHRYPQMRLEQGQIGDPDKYAQRVYEVVTGDGFARELVARPTSDGKWEGPWEFSRVPIGEDCYTLLKQGLDAWGENLRAFEAIATSTNVEQERLQYFPRG